MVVIRGAICTDNTVESISQAAVELVSEIIAQNALKTTDIFHVLFTSTSDLNKVYPAKAVRENLLPFATYNCVQEMNVENSLDHCLRISLFVNVDLTDVKHCYVGRAKSLRADL